MSELLKPVALDETTAECIAWVLERQPPTSDEAPAELRKWLRKSCPHRGDPCEICGAPNHE